MDRYSDYTAIQRKGWSNRRVVTASLENVLWSKTSGARKFRAWLVEQGHVVRRPTSDAIRARYESLHENLTRAFPETAIQTEEERQVVSYFREKTKLRFWTSAWVSNFNIDIFIPSIAADGKPLAREGMKGLAIEIDGPVHDEEFKMKRDDHKSEALARLGIGLTVIRNEDVYKGRYRNIVDALVKHQRVGHRTRKNLLRRVHLETLAYHAPVTLSDLYGTDFQNLSEAATNFFKGATK